MTLNLYMNKIGKNAKDAFKNLSGSNIKNRNAVLIQFCAYLKSNKNLLLKANKKDLLKLKENKSNMRERLILDNHKINQIISSVKKIIKFKNPVDKELASWKRPNGLVIKRVSIPIGIIGVIYESRPNVTSDVSALAFKSGNVVILRGGSDASHSNRIISNLFRKALKKKNLIKIVFNSLLTKTEKL